MTFATADVSRATRSLDFQFDRVEAPKPTAEKLIFEAGGHERPDVDKLVGKITEMRATDLKAAEAMTQSVSMALKPTDVGDLLRRVAEAVKKIIADAARQPECGLIKNVASPADAPKEITFPPEVQKIFDAQWQASFPGGRSREQGGTLVMDRQTGQVSVQNIGGHGSTSGSFNPNVTPSDPSRYEVLGVFHTHPYDKTEGSHTGVSLSGGDAAYLINNKDQKIIIAQSGNQQYAYVRTSKTPDHVDATKLNNDQNNRIAALTKQGKSFPEASRIAARETAEKYNLAYYEGSNGKLARVYPN